MYYELGENIPLHILEPSMLRHYRNRDTVRLTPLLPSILILFAVALNGLWLPQSHASAADTDQVRLAEEWLGHIDNSHYSRSWDTAAGYLKKQIPTDQWTRNLTTHRQPFGSVLTRHHQKTDHRNDLPNVPKGSYAIVYFATSFEHKREAMETVVLYKEADGAWKSIGYTIK